MSTWTQLPPLAQDRINIGCACCSTACRIAHPEMEIAVGFGAAFLTRGDEVLYSESQNNPVWTVADAERLASADPDHDWRITKDGPLHGETFQRHMTGEYAGKWVCVESNQGFA